MSIPPPPISKESSDDNSNGFVKVNHPDQPITTQTEHPSIQQESGQLNTAADLLDMDFGHEENQGAIGKFSEQTAAQVTDLRYEDLSAAGGHQQGVSDVSPTSLSQQKSTLDSLEAFLATEDDGSVDPHGQTSPGQGHVTHATAPPPDEWAEEPRHQHHHQHQAAPNSPGADSGADTLADMVSAAEVRHSDYERDEDIYHRDRPLTVPQHVGNDFDSDRAPGSCDHACGMLSKLKPIVLELIYWRDAKKSGLVLAATLAMLLCIAKFSVLSLLAYAGLLVLAGTLTWRVYELVLKQLHKPLPEKPLDQWLAEDTVKLPNEKAHQQFDVVLEHVQHLLDAVRRLLLIEKPVDTVKFGVLLWALTYVGAWISGVALAAICLIAAFTLPKVYEVYQEPIDMYWNMASEQVNKVVAQVQEAAPFLKAKQQ